MGMTDLFAPEDRIEVKFSQFYAMMKDCARYELVLNGIKYKIPHAHMEAMLTGELSEERENGHDSE